MSLILVHSNLVYSTLYGWDGSKEVRAFMKKKRFGREYLRSEGHPTDEHLDLPISKAPNTLSSVSNTEFRQIQAQKASQKGVLFIPTLEIDRSEEHLAQGLRRYKQGNRPLEERAA